MIYRGSAFGGGLPEMASEPPDRINFGICAQCGSTQYLDDMTKVAPDTWVCDYRGNVRDCLADWQAENE